MGYYVHFSVTYSSDLHEIEKLTALVEKHRARLEEYNTNRHESEFSVDNEAFLLLDAILDPRNYNCGHKGELFTWGVVGNYTSVERIIKWLAPFFTEQLKLELGPFDFDHIILFQENEGSNQAQCWELFLAKDGFIGRTDELIIKHHELPFLWNQM